MNIPSTITEQIETAENLEISYRILHPSATLYNVDTDETITLPFSSMCNKYKDYLSTIILSKELNDESQALYKYKPKMVSENLYGTTELWDIILILNNCFSVKDFTPKVLKYYDPTKFKRYLNEIMILEGIS